MLPTATETHVGAAVSVCVDVINSMSCFVVNLFEGKAFLPCLFKLNTELWGLETGRSDLRGSRDITYKMNTGNTVQSEAIKCILQV